jgi:hypothetical protein
MNGRRLAAAVGAALLAAAALATGPAAAAPPTQLWYRVTATASITKAGDFTHFHREARWRVRLRSRAAVLLYRQCTPLAPGTLAPRQYAFVLSRSRTSYSCPQLRAALRRSLKAAQIRRLRLVEDIRFTARAEGTLDEFERWTDYPARPYVDLSGEKFACPPLRDQIARVRTARSAPDGFRSPLPAAVRWAPDRKVAAPSNSYR